MEVCSFLGVTSTIRVFITDYVMISKLLVDLTWKDVIFKFTPIHLDGMQQLVHLVLTCPAITAIDYASEQEVILAVDSSYIGAGFWLSQIGEDSKHYPSHYDSISWHEWESHYSQAKIKSSLDSSVHFKRLRCILSVSKTWLSRSMPSISGHAQQPQYSA